MISLDQVSDEQLRMMKHALGLNYKKKPYRNHFYCSSNNKEWNDLVDKGFATKSGGWDNDSAYYYVTFEATKLIYGNPISKKYFDQEM